MVAQVSASANRPPTVPSWFSEMLPLSFDLSLDIGKFRRYMDDLFTKKKSREEIIDFINKYLYVDENGANALYEYFYEQFHFSQIPSDKKIVVEIYNDGNQTYYLFHTLFGRRVNDCLSRALAFAIARTQHINVEIGINDNGFYITSLKKINPLNALNLLKSKELRAVCERAIERTEVLKRRFRHCATRSLMILRSYKGRKKRVGRQQVSSMILMNAVKRISPDFVILKEARREVLEDLMDIENATEVMKRIEKKEVRIKKITTTLSSPFAFNLITQGYVDIMKMEDKIEFIRKMHNKILAKIGKKKGYSLI